MEGVHYQAEIDTVVAGDPARAAMTARPRCAVPTSLAVAKYGKAQRLGLSLWREDW